MEKVHRLEVKLQEKDKEISDIQYKLDEANQQNEEEVFRLSEKDIQLEGKDQELVKLRELLNASKVI